MSSKQPVLGHVPCPFPNCNHSCEVREFARTSQGEKWGQCPQHGKFEGRLKNAPDTAQYIESHLNGTALAVQPTAEPEQDALDPLNETFKGELPDEVKPPTVTESDEAPDETPDKPKKFSLKKALPFGLVGAGLLMLLRGGK